MQVIGKGCILMFLGISLFFYSPPPHTLYKHIIAVEATIDKQSIVYVSLLFPASSLKTFRRLLDPHFSPTEVYVVSVNFYLETIHKHTARFGPS